MQLYRFLTGSDDVSFCHKVTYALNKGWKLHGNPCYSINIETGKMQCGQAVIKNVQGQYTSNVKLADY